MDLMNREVNSNFSNILNIDLPSTNEYNMRIDGEGMRELLTSLGVIGVNARITRINILCSNFLPLRIHLLLCEQLQYPVPWQIWPLVIDGSLG